MAGALIKSNYQSSPQAFTVFVRRVHSANCALCITGLRLKHCAHAEHCHVSGGSADKLRVRHARVRARAAAPRARDSAGCACGREASVGRRGTVVRGRARPSLRRARREEEPPEVARARRSRSLVGARAAVRHSDNASDAHMHKHRERLM